MRVAIEAHVAEVLREGDPKGVHVDEIARASCIDAGKLGKSSIWSRALSVDLKG